MDEVYVEQELFKVKATAENLYLVSGMILKDTSLMNPGNVKRLCDLMLVDVEELRDTIESLSDYSEDK